jgi:trans-aconitate methyltransferase
MELKEKIKNILNEERINPEVIIDLGCGMMPYSDLFPNSEIIGLDINQNISLYNKTKQNPKIQFRFQNLNINQNLPRGDLVIASLILHFIKEQPLKELFNQIKKSKYLLVAHLDKKIEIPPEFEIIKIGELQTEKEMHDNLPAHSHKIFIELFKNKLFNN